MLGSIRIGSVLGIQVRVHWLFLALVAFLMLMAARKPGGDPLGILLLIVALFGVVFLHELGHSLVARHYGIRVLDITFWPLGGMARMTEIPEDSKIEGLIALAGPAVNFALAFLALPFWIWARLSTGGEVSPLAETVGTASGVFLFINLMLGGFNLLPAFPMDGGRVLRAVLGRNGDWLGATERAVQVGKLFAFAMFVGGFVLGLGPMISLIGVFVWFAGSRELMAVRLRHAPQPTGFGGLGGLQNLFEAARRAQAEAQGARPPSATDNQGPVFTVPPPPQAPRAGAEAPAHRPTPEVPPKLGHGRLTDEEIARLESFRGRLGRLDREE